VVTVVQGGWVGFRCYGEEKMSCPYQKLSPDSFVISHYIDGAVLKFIFCTLLIFKVLNNTVSNAEFIYGSFE
jgi:hypothetical protein